MYTNRDEINEEERKRENERWHAIYDSFVHIPICERRRRRKKNAEERHSVIV